MKKLLRLCGLLNILLLLALTACKPTSLPQNPVEATDWLLTAWQAGNNEALDALLVSTRFEVAGAFARADLLDFFPQKRLIVWSNPEPSGERRLLTINPELISSTTATTELTFTGKLSHSVTFTLYETLHGWLVHSVE